MIVYSVNFERVVPGIAPKNCSHSQLVRKVKCLRNFFQLLGALSTSPIDGCTNSNGTHIPCVFDGTEQRLIITVRKAQKFIMVDLNYERNLMGIFSTHNAQHPKRGCNCITPAFYCKT